MGINFMCPVKNQPCPILAAFSGSLHMHIVAQPLVFDHRCK